MSDHDDPGNTVITADRARELLAELVGPEATLRPDQLGAIEELVDRGRRVLLVQRTGWGKSAVYFIATKLLREAGRGPTILVSPLLALMRNQIQMAERMGVRAVTINSSNPKEWDPVKEALDQEQVDLILVSPERFSNAKFREEVMPTLAKRTGLFVIDEVHCVSDWGHDFRPDYRRVARILRLLPDGIPVLGTTATANDRVVNDVVAQLGEDLTVLRGTLARDGLALQVLSLLPPAQRLAWLARAIPELDGSGIVYCLTISDAQRVAQWLRENRINAVAYSGEVENETRMQIEDDLLANRVKVVVATSALGMGFDKPDLAFVIHYQSPGSPIAYYQQVGRAGRALERSLGILLIGNEDQEIQDYFIRTAFPPEHLATKIVELLETEGRALTVRDIEARVNIKHTRLQQMLKILEVEGVFERAGSKYQRTSAAWTYPKERVEGVTAARRQEQEVMRSYASTTKCLMEHLRNELDDPSPVPCGICMNCAAAPLTGELNAELVIAATNFLRHRPIGIEPRAQWPAGVEDRSGRIPLELRLEPGRALCLLGDGGWSDLVRDGKRKDERFSDELVKASAQVIREWAPQPAPTWMTYVPSLRSPVLCAEFAERLGAELGLPVRSVVENTRDHRPQDEMDNSAQQYLNVTDAFVVSGAIDPDPVLLIDDLSASRWTMTVIGVALREAGSGPVHPFALATAVG